MTLGARGKTILTESARAYPESHYQALEYSIEDPQDTDGDGMDDITEYRNIPFQNPLNAAQTVEAKYGAIFFERFKSFSNLSFKKDSLQHTEFLNNKKFVKFLILDFYSDNPKLYFIHSENVDRHLHFVRKLGMKYFSGDVIKGQLIYHPAVVSNNGTFGTFTFNFSNERNKEFPVVQKCYELLTSSMPFLENNLAYYITAVHSKNIVYDFELYEESRVPVLFQDDLYAKLDYWGLHQAEGFGFFRKMNMEELPSARDIVHYKQLPNELTRVGGIMTSALQTPLSHVNLRAIQNGIPNAFIRDPLDIDSIANLLGQYIYYRVEQNKYTIRKATLDEVNEWYNQIRPKEEQDPPLNLNVTEIMPLDDITFDLSNAFGAKCANVATMRTFGFPEGTIPNGYGVPFYYYQEFMKYNGFFDQANAMFDHDQFQYDRTIRKNMLKEFRRNIKDADMPPWMLDELAKIQALFPAGTSIRCRSSTNNEDLQAFNGAGLYNSKTQHPDEGHISKSIKEVYASLWNLRAYEEREFYRIDQLLASMGVLCHPNYSNEKANGVGLSIDPFYETENTFYLNTQLEEELVTNPTNDAIPEQILLYVSPENQGDYEIIQRSNLMDENTLIMNENYLNQISHYLTIIHEKFAILYEAVDEEKFAVDIEYKISNKGKLIIKQARPW